MVRDDSVDVLRAYALDNGGLARRFPAGITTNVNIENDDDAAQRNGYGLSHVALGGSDRLYMAGDRFLCQLKRSTLQIVVQNFGNVGHVEIMGNFVVPVGGDIQFLAQDAPGLTNPTVLHDTDDYLSTTSFCLGNDHYVAISAEHGSVVVATLAGAPAEVVTSVDTEFDTARIHQFFGTPKGIAFDQTTRQLLIGDSSRVIVVKADEGFVLPDDDAGDYILPGDSEVDVAAMVARGGFAWALLRRGTDNLIKLDRSQRPPVFAGVATIPVDSFGRAMAIGCRRIFITGPGKVVAVRRDDSGAAGSLTVDDIERIRLVGRGGLGLDGDD